MTTTPFPAGEDDKAPPSAFGVHPSDAAPGHQNVTIDCGWGRLIFAQTFTDARDLAQELAQETEGRRDVAFYVEEPHVVLARAPLALFLDPSHAFRLPLADLPAVANAPSIRPADAGDASAINRIYAARRMVPLREGYVAEVLAGQHPVTILVAVDPAQGGICGVVMGVDHVAAFADPGNGSSLWALAVDPQSTVPAIGRQLTLALSSLFEQRGRAFMDLSVLCDNAEAIGLYRKLGFSQVPVFCIKKKNPINEKLFVGDEPGAQLNVYAQIIVDEARRRGIWVEIEDAAAGLFRLVLGGRAVACRESLSDLTSAVALSRCNDKALTRRLLAAAEVNVPDQVEAGSDEEVRAFFERHHRLVVKPAEGEQGRGVYVDLRSIEDVRDAVAENRATCERVLLEQFVEGDDLRIIVIDGKVVAGAVRKPATIIGDGEHAIAELIAAQSRRRAAATRGESRIPEDGETERCVRDGGYAMQDVLPAGEALVVRKAANLHTGGTIHDVTADLHPQLCEAAERAAKVLDIPVVGLDLLVSDVAGPDYVIIEANERPGLANHEPQPTAQRFVDLLFPQTRSER